MRLPAGWLGSLAVFCSLLSGCDPATLSCQRSSDCDPDELCVASRCHQACNTNRECKRSEACSEGACLPITAQDASALDAKRIDISAPERSAVDAGNHDTSGADLGTRDHRSADRDPPDRHSGDMRRLDAGPPERPATDRRAHDLGGEDRPAARDGSSPLEAGLGDRRDALDAERLDVRFEDSAGIDGGSFDIAPAAVCSDRQVHSPETCDDGNLINGDGCSASCTIELGWRCDAFIPTLGSRCTEICGDDRIVGDELCDGAHVNGATCTSLSFLPGSAEPRCGSTCRDYLFDGCGPRITCGTLQQAIDSASRSSTHQVISIPPMDCLLNLPLTINACLWGCANPGPRGITLRPLADPVILRGGGEDCVVVRSGNNIIEGLNFEDCDDAVALRDSNPWSGSNTVRHNRILNVNTEPRVPLRVLSAGNTVWGNWIENQNQLSGADAIRVEGNDTRVVLNVVYGDFNSALDVKADGVVIDANTLWAASSTGATSGMTALTIKRATGLCMRNNLLLGDGASTAYELQPTLELNPPASCPGGGSSHNAVAGFADQCVGSVLLCNLHCRNDGPLCDFAPAQPPLLNSTACLPASSPLVDQGLDLGYDRVESSDARYLGAAPELGALESGAAHSFGDQIFVCP